MKARTLIAAGLLSASSMLAHAEDPQDHDAHHPNAASQPAPQPQPRGMGQGMMGQGMMSQGGMAASNSMMGGGGMPMAGMMQMMMGSSGMGGMATIDRIEGRIAFLKTELKITDQQADTWNAFAEILRSNARKLGELRAAMTPQASLADRLAWQEKWLEARSENTRTIRVAYDDLAAKLSEDQKKSAEQLLAPHVGMMAMMSGMGPGQMMGGMAMGQMGGMSSGQMPMMPGNPMTTGKMSPGR
jgi:hypothetical protein